MTGISNPLAVSVGPSISYDLVCPVFFVFVLFFPLATNKENWIRVLTLTLILGVAQLTCLMEL